MTFSNAVFWPELQVALILDFGQFVIAVHFLPTQGGEPTPFETSFVPEAKLGPRHSPEANFWYSFSFCV